MTFTYILATSIFEFLYFYLPAKKFTGFSIFPTKKDCFLFLLLQLQLAFFPILILSQLGQVLQGRHSCSVTFFLDLLWEYYTKYFFIYCPLY